MKKTIFFMIIILMSTGMIYSIKVRSPNGGENWPLGKTRTIRWIASRGAGNFKLILLKDGTKLGNIAVNVPARRSSYRWTVGQYEGGSAGVGRGYKIRVKQMGAPISDASNGTFNITLGVVAHAHIVEGISILSPARGDRIRNGTNTTIRWRMPSSNACGDKVDLFVKKVGTSLEYNIRRNVACSTGENSYSWYVHTPDFTGTPADFKIKIVSSSGCSKESDPFQIVSSRDNTDETRSDYLIDSVTLFNGLSLNHGLTYTPGSDISNTFQVNVKWNKVEPSSSGSHSVEVKSVLTGDTVHLANNPAHFSFEEANSRTGIIRILVPFNIAHSKYVSMVRGRFIPLSFRLVFNPSTCDNFAPNNREEFKMRVLERGPSADFVVEIVPNSLKVERKRKRKTRVDFEIQVKVRNLAKTDAGGSSRRRLNDVPCSWKNSYRSSSQSGFKRGIFRLPMVTSYWVFHTIRETVFIPVKYRLPVTFSITVDKDEQFLDPNRENNTVSLEYQAPD